MGHLLLACAVSLMVSLVSGGLLYFALEDTDEPQQPTFAERVQQELQNPDPDVRAALREVDRIGWSAPSVGVPDPVPATIVAGGAVRVAPHPAMNDRRSVEDYLLARNLQAMNAGRTGIQQLSEQAQMMGGYRAGLDNAQIRYAETFSDVIKEQLNVRAFWQWLRRGWWLAADRRLPK